MEEAGNVSKTTLPLPTPNVGHRDGERKIHVLATPTIVNLPTKVEQSESKSKSGKIQKQIANMMPALQMNKVRASVDSLRISQQRKRNGGDDDDMSSRAAVALAAVAAAATANNASPSAAAQAARAVAQTFVLNASRDSKSSSTGMSSEEKEIPRKMQSVNVVILKEKLKGLITENEVSKMDNTTTSLLNRLANGENDTLLHYLLLIEYFRAVNEEIDSSDKKGAKGSGNEDNVDLTNEQCVAANAADLIFSLVKKAEGAYDSLVGMLPSMHKETSKNHARENHTEKTEPEIIPDLLPRAYASKGGDPTLAFFRACTEKIDERMKNTSESTENSSSEFLVSASEPSRSHKSRSNVFQKTYQSNPVVNGLPSIGKLGSGNGGSVLSNMFSSFKMSAVSGSKGMNVFRKNQRGLGKVASARNKEANEHATNSHTREYTVQIEREMLGLTVENVLERTVVRTVLAGGPAKKAGAKVGSLIVKVGSVETKNLTHFETIDELRQSQRPLQMALRVVSDESLRSAREEMGRLITGAGFGVITGGFSESNGNENTSNNTGQLRKPLVGGDLNIDTFTNLIRRRFKAVTKTKNKKEETLEHATEKLVWILTLLVIGLEREACNLFSSENGSNEDFDSSSTSRNLYNHTAQDYTDAAKSVSKILFDFVKKKLDPSTMNYQRTRPSGIIGAGGVGSSQRTRKSQMISGNHMGSPGRGGARHRPMVPGMQPSKAETPIKYEKPLLQIGDILHRTRTFFSNPTSPPAALLRGEVIAFLCDVLDIDTGMELSEEEISSSNTGANAGPITDLGSAGGLLKLIVLNCSFMRSPCYDVASADSQNTDPEVADELKRRFGVREKYDAADLHSLHAGNRFLSVVHRLAASRSTSARITACSLAPVLWGHLDFPRQLQLRGVITRALHDAEVIVRKSTATVLHEIAELVFDARSVPWLVLMCERAMTDPEPPLRSAAMTLTWHLAEHLPNAFLGDASKGSRFLRRLPNRDDPIFADVYLLQCKLLPVATRLADDRSASVRISVAAQCDRLCHALGNHWSSVIIDVLLALLSDSDERVRSEAVLCVPRLSETVLQSIIPGTASSSEDSVLQSLLPATINLQKDKSPMVRISLATCAGELLTLLVGLQSAEENRLQHLRVDSDVAVAPNRHFKKHVDDILIPLVQRLLHDSDPEVTSSALRAVTNASRGTVHSASHHSDAEDSVSISSLSHASRERKDPVFLPVLSEDQVLRLLPTLAELANSRQWRVRQSAVEIVPALLGCTHRLETRAEISQLCIRLMSDCVDAVRRTAAECLCLGGGSLGSQGEGDSAEWITSIVIPKLRKCAMHESSKQRILSLRMIETIFLNGACPSRWKGDSGGEILTDSPVRELVVIALSLTNDKVPNIRLNVGRALANVIHVFEEDELSFIKEVLIQQFESEKERENGSDCDVLFFASRCINKAQAILEEGLPHNDSSDM